MRRIGRLNNALLLVAILLAGSYFRFVGLDWGENQAIHPDEEFLRQVTTAVRLPDHPAQYLDTTASPLNPYNQGYGFFVYGTLPLFLTRAIGEGLDPGCEVPYSLPARLLAPPLLGRGVEECWPGAFSGAGARMIGRSLAALFDLGSLVFVFLIGRRLGSRSVGLLAALLYALTALAIQQAHFYTVDAFANLFVAATLYFALRAAQNGGWGSFALAGLSTGLGMACKISVWPLALMVALAGVAWVVKSTAAAQTAGSAVEPDGSGLVRDRRRLVAGAGRVLLAGLLAALAFRVAQPYAFMGPGFLGLRPNPQWLQNMSQIRQLMSGVVDTPPNHQWTSRTPIVFPWVNMVFWGMGLPLGLAAWAGWAAVAVVLFRRWRAWRDLAAESLPYGLSLAWIWGTGYFVYQSTQWVKSVRYLLPVYPVFVAFAAWLVVRLWTWAWERRGARVKAAIAAVGLLVLGGALCWALAFSSIYTHAHTRIAASRWIFENVPLGSVLATEHWDWAPPLRVDGRDPFRDMYRGLSDGADLQLYHDDTAEKRESLLDWLDEADYIITGSNRLYASVSRLPTRYPLTIAYYSALFSGELGFELVADFASYPALGPFQFPDQEEPFPVPEALHQYLPAAVRVPMPPAEEAFSVYDHPRVLVFRRTERYSRALAETILNPSLLDRVVWVSPRQLAPGFRLPLLGTGGGPAARSPMLDEETWSEQRAGGTWSGMFDRQSVLNRAPWLGALVWYVTASVLGWVAFPVLFAALPRLADRGYGLARTVALLLVGYLTWLSASLRVLPNTRGTVALAAGLLVVAGGAVAWSRRRELYEFVRRRWRLLLVYEGLSLVLFVVWVCVRALNPDLWHPVVGGEKPMDFAYLNAVIRSTWFPPYDPWFAGGYMNYYYFGFVLAGSLAKLLGIVPSIAYNLTLPLFYTLTGVAAFSVGFNLAGGRDGDSVRRRYLAGGLAVLFLLLLGNLGEVRLLLAGLRAVAGETGFESTIPGFPELVQVVRGLGMVLRGASLPFRPETPYWDPTRMFPHPAFAEFPAFTFVYADPHAHMLALPYTLVALALAVNWARGGQRLGQGFALSLPLGGVVAGSLLAANTWDYPVFLFAGVVGLALGVWLSRQGVGAWLWRAAGLVAVSVVSFLPFLRSYIPQLTGLTLWRDARIPLDSYLLMVGQFLLPLVTVLAIHGRSGVAQAWRLQNRTARLLRALGAAAVLVLVPVLAASSLPVAAVTVPVGLAAAAGAARLKEPVEERLLWVFVALAMAVCLAVDLVAVGGDRMNTVFKFYYQTWTLLSISAAVAVAWLAGRARTWSVEWRQAWWAGMGVLLLSMALFPVMAIPAKVGDRIGEGTGLTLDGMAYMESGRVGDVRGEVNLGPDYAAIVWLQEHVEGSPVILEGLGEREYLWGNRISIYTGLPTVVGWRWHQIQQRGMSDEVDQRRWDVAEFYGTMDVDRAWEILQQYEVEYVVVGPYERLYYDPRGLAKLGLLVADGRLRVVYDQGGVRIYQVAERE